MITEPAVLTTPRPPITGRVARMRAALDETMLRPQETWRPASLLDDPALAALPLMLRRSHGVARTLAEMPIEIGPDDLIVGKTARAGVIVRTSFPEFASQAEKDQARAEGFSISNRLSHKTPAYPDLLAKGLGGILAEVAAKRAEISARPASDENAEALRLMDAMQIELEAVIGLARRYAGLADALAAGAQPDRAAELRRIAAVCRRVPEHPPATFHEALQSVWFVHYAFCSSNTWLSLGRFDQYTGPYLERDLAAGRITIEEAQELIDCLWIKFNDRAQILRETFAGRYVDGKQHAGTRFRTLVANDASDAVNHWGQNMLLSGLRADGSDGTNPVTYLALNSMETFAYTSPVVTVRLHRASPPELVRRAAQVLKGGGAMPYIDNDDVLIPAYEKLGVPHADAVEYANSNCWETMIAGMSDQELIRGFNFLLVLEWALNRGHSPAREGALEGVDTGDPRTFASFDDLLAAWKAQMDAYIASQIDYIGSRYPSCSLDHSNHGRYSYNPLLSALTADCVAREKDVIRGGARYVIWHCMAEAVANCIDALSAVRKLVYEDGAATMDTMLAALAANWEGYENLRLLCMTRPPRYANAQAPADALGRELLDYFSERVRHHAARYPEIIFPCSVGTFSWYTSIGKEVGATPDGRMFAEAVTPNFAPSLGADQAGPTAAVKSYCAMPGVDLAGGAPLDLRFSGSHLRGEEGTDRLAGFIRAFLALGGNMMTITVTNVEDLYAAQREPMKYRGLRVRMGGWTAYFIALSREQQDLHIRRVEHGL